MRAKQSVSSRERGDFSFRMALLGGVSILPMAVVFAAPAFASCPGPVTGNIIGPVDTTGGCNFAVSGGGVVSGGSTGVINQVSIGALANSGTVTGSIYGINNRVAPINQAHVIVWNAVAATPGSIGTLMNTGVITGGSDGIDNATTIGSLANSGTISGRSAAVISYGTIGSLTNNGLIGSRLPSADFSGITNYGTIGLLDNEAGIFASAQGIFNGGLIETLTNSGRFPGR